MTNMKKFNISVIMLYFFILIKINAQNPWEGLVTPTNTSGVFQAQAMLNGIYPSQNDWIAAIDENGNCAGTDTIWIVNQTSYINLTIYGDDPTSIDIDEGINAGEDFILRLWDSSEDIIYEYGVSFDCWYNNNGAPMSGCGSPTTVYNFEVSMGTNELMHPYKVSLYNNFPNPFNHETIISYDINISTNIILEVFDLRGRNYRKIIKNNLFPGTYSMKLNSNFWGRQMISSGIYFYRLTYEENYKSVSILKKMVLMK